MIKGLFYASLGAGAALMVDYVFNITGNSHYMTKQLLVALGQPIPPTKSTAAMRNHLIAKARAPQGALIL